MDIREAETMLFSKRKIKIFYCTDNFKEQSTLRAEMDLVLLCIRENKMHIYLHK